MRRFRIKTLHDKLLEAECRRGKAQVCVPCNADRALADGEGDGNVAESRIADPCELGQETHA